MNRRFNRTRLVKLVQAIMILSVVLPILTVVISKHYSNVSFNNYNQKQAYCYDKYWNDNMQTYAYCFKKELDTFIFWRDIENISPYLSAGTMVLSLIGFGFYRYLFTKK